MLYYPEKTVAPCLLVCALILFASSAQLWQSTNATFKMGAVYASHDNHSSWDTGLPRKDCQATEVDKDCMIELDVPNDSEGPYVVSYIVTPFYQNYNQMLKNLTLQTDSEFSDTFKFPGWTGALDESGIAWPSDVKLVTELLHIKTPVADHMAVWARPSGFPIVAKRYGVLPKKALKKGDKIMVTIHQEFDAESIQSSKAITLAIAPSVYGKELAKLSFWIGSIATLAAILAAFFSNTKEHMWGGEPISDSESADEPLLDE